MKQSFKISGMTCGSCETTVRSSLLALATVKTVEVSRSDNSLAITSDTHLDISTLQKALGKKYTLSENTTDTPPVGFQEVPESSWLETYKPVLLIFAYITGVTLLIQWAQGTFDFMQWMGHFMAGFFLVFSFFKLLDLRSFADSYRMYDIVAKRFLIWGYIYAFIELGLGIAYLVDFAPILTNSIMVVVMTISIIGVLQSVLNKRKIQCACLGAVFNLPMSTITIIEDGLMIVMGVIMLLLM